MAFELANADLKELDRLRKEQDHLIRKINTFHAKLQASPEHADYPNNDFIMKLRGYYYRAKTLAEEEASVSNNCIEHLDGLIAAQAPANRKKPEPNDKKRKRARVDDSARLSSPNQRTTNVPYGPGDQGNKEGILIRYVHKLELAKVAARISSDEADNHEWIVVKVTRYDPNVHKYDVIDEEPDDEGNGQRKYKLHASCIIPFTKRSDVSNAPDFPIGSSVLAVYPGTTALYKAAVVAPQRKKRSDDYSLEFDGDEEDGQVGLPKRNVPFNHVVLLPSGHRQ